MHEKVTQNIDQQVLDLAEEYWQGILKVEPVYATKVGERQCDGFLPDLSESGRADRETLHRSTRERAGRIHDQPMGREARIVLDIVKAVSSRGSYFAEDRADERWAVNHLGPLPESGPGALLIAITQVQQVGCKDDAERYIQRLAGLPTYLTQARQLAQAGLESGRGVAAAVVNRTREQFVRFLAERPDRSIALKPLATQEQAVLDSALDVLRDSVYPSYEEFSEFLKGYLESTRDDIGLTERPGGEASYEHEMLGWTDASSDPKELHQLGLSLLEQIDEERLACAVRLGYSTLADALDDSTARADGWYELHDEVLEAARDQTARAAAEARRWFGHLPTSGVSVSLIPPELEDDVLDYYRPASADGKRLGTYYVHGQRRPRYLLASTTFHEAIPGHHFQSSIEGEAANRSALQTYGSGFHSGAYREGWGLYSERLAEEMGLFEDDYERLGMLSLQAMRAARLVVDTGLHAFGWSRERAIELMSRSGLLPNEAILDVDRYIALPAQALSYMVGMNKVMESRHAATARGIPLKDFHDAVLAMGAVPLTTLHREVEQL